MNSVISYKWKKREKTWRNLQGVRNLVFRVRRLDFSLKTREIRLSKSFGPRRKVVLRGAGNTWTPVLRSFDKLRDVGDLSYLGFTLYLNVL